jgi:Protein of unknown function (DUF3500)
MKKTLLPILFCSVLITCQAQNNIVQTANRFLGSLTSEQQKKATYAFTDDERYNWHFIPKNDRKGVVLEELSDQQKENALSLLKLCMSETGYKKAASIMQLEVVLKALENRADSDNTRNPQKYYFSFFGTPAEKAVWGWRLEGHHCSINFSVENGRLTAGTPGFMGSNPAIVPSGPEKGKQILKEETGMGFAFLHTLSSDQLSKAVIDAKAPGDIITFNNRKAMIENPKGIMYADLSKKQQAQMMDLVKLYIHRYTKLFADDMLKELQTAGLNKLQFAWAGDQQQDANKGCYYRIQGPTIIIEYDNTQNNANHVHSVIRDLKHDFGGDELLAHYKQEHN